METQHVNRFGIYAPASSSRIRVWQEWMRYGVIPMGKDRASETACRACPGFLTSLQMIKFWDTDYYLYHTPPFVFPLSLRLMAVRGFLQEQSIRRDETNPSIWFIIAVMG